MAVSCMCECDTAFAAGQLHTTMCDRSRAHSGNRLHSVISFRKLHQPCCPLCRAPQTSSSSRGTWRAAAVTCHASGSWSRGGTPSLQGSAYGRRDRRCTPSSRSCQSLLGAQGWMETAAGWETVSLHLAPPMQDAMRSQLTILHKHCAVLLVLPWVQSCHTGQAAHNHQNEQTSSSPKVLQLITLRSISAPCNWRTPSTCCAASRMAHRARANEKKKRDMAIVVRVRRILWCCIGHAYMGHFAGCFGSNHTALFKRLAVPTDPMQAALCSAEFVADIKGCRFCE